MSALPEWMRPPRPEGWFAEDLDQLAEAPRHTELIDGALAFRTSPQRSWHGRLVTALVLSLSEQAPVIHTYELDRPTRSYAPTGIHRRELSSPTPFAINLDLDKLVPGRKP